MKRLIKLPRFTPRVKLGLVITAVIPTLIFSYLVQNYFNLSKTEATDAVERSVAASQNSEFWSQRIDDIGATNAYQEFKKEIVKEKLSFQHGLSHFMGELLYQKLGLDGFAVCDAEFNYSCYHGFFSAAFSSEGTSVLEDVNRVCLDKYNPRPSPCQHGIGHGLMSYLGRGKLVEALSYCKLTNQSNPLHGCTSGLFMEYNASSHFSTKDGVIDRRVLNPDNPHEPCNTIVPAEFRGSCYAEIPLWWREVYNRDFETIGRLCQVIENKVEQSACYFGVGIVIAPTTNYNSNEVINLCKKMPDLSGEWQCRAEAFKVFKALPDYQTAAYQICEGLPQPEKTLCEKN